jgi:enoyl-CoA hydratase/carnithine racemase
MGSWSTSQEGGILVLALTRPPGNTLDAETWRGLDRLLQALVPGAAPQGIVITIGLDGVACASGDLDPSEGHVVTQSGREVLQRLEAAPVPTIGAISGQVGGDGLVLALACDLRIASADATFRLPDITHGFVGRWGMIGRLILAAGRSHGAGTLRSSPGLSAERARALGLVHGVVRAPRVLGEALALARHVMTLSPAALRAAKCALEGGDGDTCFATVSAGPDWDGAVDALLAKRSSSDRSRG